MESEARTAPTSPTTVPPLPEGFRLPDWDAPLDVEAQLALVPPEAAVRGMFFSQVQQEYRKRGLEPPTTESFQAFQRYPMRRLMELLVDAAGTVHADVPLREGLRRLGHGAYGVFADSLVGRTLFSALGHDVGRIFGLAGRAWPHAATAGSLEVEDAGERSVRIRAHDFVLFPECTAVGIAEGVLLACERPGVVACRPESSTRVDFWIHWE